MTNKGQCPKCNQPNEYNQVFCGHCGERLPWADAIVEEKNKAAASVSEQARLAGRINAGMDSAGLTRDKVLGATKNYLNSPEFKESAANEAQFWAKFGGFMGGCFMVCVALLIIFFICAALFG